MSYVKKKEMSYLSNYFKGTKIDSASKETFSFLESFSF